jgi:cathepsin B
MMKVVLLCLVAACSALVLPQHRKISPELQKLTGLDLVNYINNNQKLWTAKLSAKFAHMTEAGKKRLINGVKMIEVPPTDREINEMTHPEIPDDTIPDTFDAIQQWANCPSIAHIRDQSACGSCWAISGAEAMSDRICIATNGATQVSISADDIMACCGFMCGDGCNGGYPIEAWRTWVSRGYVTGGDYGSNQGCKPYPFAQCEHHTNGTHYKPCPADIYPTDKCLTQCEDGYSKSYNEDKWFGKSAYAVSKKVAEIQKELMTNGPIELAYSVYEDFEHYTGGIYTHTAGSYLGGHAVKLVGWGTENGTPFWRIANSWNTDWGENGYFRIIRGVNECGIESGAVAGLPKV